jgi:hypothetical protein
MKRSEFLHETILEKRYWVAQHYKMKLTHYYK